MYVSRRCRWRDDRRAAADDGSRSASPTPPRRAVGLRCGSVAVASTAPAPLCLAPTGGSSRVPEAGRDGLLAALAGTTVPMRRRRVSDREITLALEALAFSTWSPPAARATSRGCRSGPAPAPCSTPPRWW